MWENFAPPPGNLTIIFCPGAGNQTEKFARVAGIRSLKKIFPGVTRGGGEMYPVGID